MITLLSCKKGELPVAPLPVHPNFSITILLLEEALVSLPVKIRNEVLRRPQVFLDLLAQLFSSKLTYNLIDKNHSIESDYEPLDLVPLDNYNITTSRPGHLLSRSILPDLLAMIEAARDDGVELMISSAYRSYNYQLRLYEREVTLVGTEMANKIVAKPGHSQHQLGTTIDFGSISTGYGETINGKWLATNAWRYGFSLSYPKDNQEITGYSYEPWHFRHVGRIVTFIEREFFYDSQQELLEFLDQWAEWFKKNQTTTPSIILNNY